MSLDVRYLELLTKGPFETKKDERNAIYAEKVLWLRKKGNMLLCSMLITDAASNAITSIILSMLVGEAEGFAISFSVLLIVGEIMPQAIANKYGLVINAYIRGISYVILFSTIIVAYPLSAILDKILGEEAGNVLSKNQMKRMFEQYEK